LFALSLLLSQGVSQSKDLKPSSLRKAEVVGNVEKQGQDLSLVVSKAIEAEYVHTSVNASYSIARRLSTVASWVQVGSDIDGESAGDNFGSSTALSANGLILAVGAVLNDATGTTDSGHVRTFELIDDTWVQLGDDIDGGDGEQSGVSVALSSDGMILAIGARYNDGNNGSNSGHVRIFELNDDTWVQLGDDIVGELSNANLGISTSISADGTKVAVGATGNISVRIFERNGEAWNQLGYTIYGESGHDYFGATVALSSDATMIAIGAPLNDDTGRDVGQVRIFELNDDTWVQLGDAIYGDVERDRFGMSVALSSDGLTVAAGAVWNDDNGSQSGHVRIFEWKTPAWVQMGDDIDGEAGSNSGKSVALSSNGQIVAIGADRNNNDNGGDAGHVRVLQWDDTNKAWNQLGGDIDGENSGDKSGSFNALALSADGTAVAIGATTNDGNGSESGHARVYSIDVDVSQCEADAILFMCIY
jgi:hypothetical protein